MHDHQDHADDRQALAVTVALLLLIGGVLLADAWTGPFTAFAAGAIPVLLGYAARPAGILRRLLRGLSGA